MSPEQQRRMPIRVLGYAAVAAVALTGTLWILSVQGRSPAVENSTDNTNALRATSEIHDRFQEVYDLTYRVDGAAGNTAVEVVYQFPGLTTRLAEYAARSSIQAETLSIVQADDDATHLPFLVTLQRNTAVGPLSWPEMVKLSAGGTDYEQIRFDPLSFPIGRDDMVMGVLWFQQKGDASPDQLRMTLTNVPGNAKSTVFTWDTKVLKLYDASPANINS